MLRKITSHKHGDSSLNDRLLHSTFRCYNERDRIKYLLLMLSIRYHPTSLKRADRNSVFNEQIYVFRLLYLVYYRHYSKQSWLQFPYRRFHNKSTNKIYLPYLVTNEEDNDHRDGVAGHQQRFV